MKKRILKYLLGKTLYPGLQNMSLHMLLPELTKPIDTRPISYFHNTGTPLTPKLNNVSFKNLAITAGIGAVTNYLSGLLTDQFGDDLISQNLGTLFSAGLGATSDTIAGNIIKGNALATGLGQNVGNSLVGAGVGIASNYIGKGISSAMGDSALGRGLGAGTSTALGSIGGRVVSNLFNGEKTLNGLSLATKAGKFNLAGIAGSAIGSGLSAAFGPSKEYNGKYGNITQIADTAYDTILAASGFFGPVGALVSGGMALNKGLSNVFGSTDGMTVQDSILGSAWMPFPVKWINMWGARTTTPFKNQSWQNTERTNAFMLNAFGDLADKFDKARNEAGKTYGTFSRSAYHKALDNLDFSNLAWNKILDMTDLNEIQNIRSQYMTSINNQRYLQNIYGGWNPVYRGKQGMKIFNNATNHNIGMRLLSGAALIDSKQMILCSAVN